MIEGLFKEDEGNINQYQGWNCRR